MPSYILTKSLISLGIHLKYLCYILEVKQTAFLSGQIAQSVEQRTENPRVGSSILPLTTTFIEINLIFNMSLRGAMRRSNPFP